MPRLPHAFLMVTLALVGCDDEHRPDEILPGSLRGVRINLQVSGPEADINKRRRCENVLAKEGGIVDRDASLTVSLFLEDNGNHLYVQARRMGLLSQPRPPWGMEELCRDALASALRISHRGESMGRLDPPPTSPSPSLPVVRPPPAAPVKTIAVAPPSTPPAAPSPPAPPAVAVAAPAPKHVEPPAPKPPVRPVAPLPEVRASEVPTEPTDPTGPIGVAATPESEARARVETAHDLHASARSRYARFDFRGAGDDWCSAYDHDPVADYLYFAAQAFRQLGNRSGRADDLRRARFFYERYQAESGGISVMRQLDQLDDQIHALEATAR